MSEHTSIYEIPTRERKAFAETLTPAELREAFSDVAAVNSLMSGNPMLVIYAEDISTFTSILEATDLQTAKQLAREALEDLVPIVIDQINARDHLREHLRSGRS